MKYIHELERQLALATGLSKVWIALQLFSFYITFGIHRAIHILFAPSYGSFALLNEQSTDGTWTQSYSQHQKSASKTRKTSIGALVSTALLTTLAFFTLQILFPYGTTGFASAETVFQVLNTNNDGPGSLRRAIEQVNAEPLGSNNIISLELPTQGTVNITSVLPRIDREVIIRNNSGQRLILNGSGMGIGAPCLEFGIDASGSAIEGMEIQNCTQEGIKLENGTNNITIGGDGENGRIGIGNVTTGISIPNNTNITITNTTIGKTLAGINAPLTQHGIFVEGGSSVAISNSETLHANNGISIHGGTATITNSTIAGNSGSGIVFRNDANGSILGSAIGMEMGTASGNGQHGIHIETSGNVTVGSAAQPNTIANNTQSGIHIEKTTGTITLSSNDIRGMWGGGLSTSFIGIEIRDSSTITATGNEVTGIAGDGIRIENSSNSTFQKNYIGKRKDSSREGNTGHGVSVHNSQNILIGATVLGDSSNANILASSGQFGVAVSGASSANVLVSKNSYDLNTEGPLLISPEVSSPTLPSDSVFNAITISGTGGPVGGVIQLYNATGAYIAQSAIIPSGGVWEIGDQSFTEGDTYRILAIDSTNTTSVISNELTVVFNQEVEEPEEPVEEPLEPTEEEPIEETPEEENEEEKIDSSLVSYLSNLTINGQRIYSSTDRIYISPKKAPIFEFETTNDEHEIQVTIKDQGETVQQSDWTSSENESTTINLHTALEKDIPVTAHGQSREQEDVTIVSDSEKIATITATRKAPRMTTLTGDYTVTTKPQNIQFGGDRTGIQQAQFRIKKVTTGELIASCTVQENEEYCSLPFALPVGEYTVYYESIKNGVPSAPDIHTLIVTPAVSTNLLQFDTRSTTYFNRIVTANTINLSGIATAGLDATVLLNGDVVNQFTRSKDESISWSTSFNASDYSLARGLTHILEIQFRNSNDEIVESSIYPFYFAHAPITPVLSDVAAEYEQYSQFTTTVSAGNNTLARLFLDGEYVTESIIESNNNEVIGTTLLPIPTSSLGNHTLTVEVEDTLGLRSSHSISYSVVSTIQPLETAENQVSDISESENTEDSTTSENQKEDVLETNEQSSDSDTIGAPTNTTNTIEDNEVIEDSESQASANEIPLFYQTIVVDPKEREELKETLNQKNQSSLVLEAITAQVNTKTGTIEDSAPVERAEDGSQIIRSTTTTGLAPLQLPFLPNTEEKDVLVFSGTTEPYAEVVVTIFSDPVVTIARADSAGQWTMTVDVEQLPEGSHTAYLQTNSRGVESDQIEIAKFVVIEEQRLSNTSWILLVNIVLVLLIFSAGTYIQLRHRFGYGSTISQNTFVDSMATNTNTELITEISNETEENIDDDDTPDYHSALSV